MRKMSLVLILISGCRTIETRNTLSADPLRCVEQSKLKYDLCVEDGAKGAQQLRTIEACRATLSVDQQQCQMYAQSPELRARQEAVEERERTVALTCLKPIAATTNQCVSAAENDKNKIAGCLDTLASRAPGCAPQMTECEARATGYLALCLEQGSGTEEDCRSKLQRWLRSCA